MYDYLRGMCEAYHAYPQTWVVTEDGKLQFGATQDAMRAPLKQLQKMYADGMIDPEFATKILAIGRGGKKPRKDLAVWKDA